MIVYCPDNYYSDYVSILTFYQQYSIIATYSQFLYAKKTQHTIIIKK
jgi:hypothetical protein